MVDFELQLRNDHEGEIIIGVCGWYSLDETQRGEELRKCLYGAICRHFGFNPIRWISRFSITREITEPNLDLIFRWKFLAVPIDEPLFDGKDWVYWALRIDGDDSEEPIIYRNTYC